MKNGQPSFQVERNVLIRAEAKTVFSFFTDSARFEEWWGKGSSIEPREGGRVLIRYPDGTEAGGQVLSISPPDSIVFSYGYSGEGKPIPFGGSEVRITLSAEDEGTRVHLVHVVESESVRDMHAPGWRFQLAQFAKAATVRQHARATDIIDSYFAAWSTDSGAERSRLLAECTEPNVVFADDFGLVVSRDELDEHIAQARKFFPGASLTRGGAVRSGHAVAVCAWHMQTQGDARNMSGTNVFRLSPRGKIREITGILDPPG